MLAYREGRVAARDWKLQWKLAAATVVAAAPAGAFAADAAAGYPSKPVRMVVPLAPGAPGVTFVEAAIPGNRFETCAGEEVFELEAVKPAHLQQPFAGWTFRTDEAVANRRDLSSDVV